MLEEFEDMLVAEGITAASEDYKKQWKAINASIRSGSGLGAKDTKHGIGMTCLMLYLQSLWTALLKLAVK